MSGAQFVPVSETQDSAQSIAAAPSTETVTAVPTVDERVPAPAGDPGLPPVELPTEIMTEAYHTAKDLVIAHFEKAYLAHLVERSGGNMSRAARLANIDRTTIYRMMERHQLTRAQLPGLIS